MLLQDIYRTIENRLKADTGEGGLYEDNTWQYGPFYSIYATPAALARPFCVFSVSQEVDQSATSDGAINEVTFTYYHDKTNTQGTSQPSTALDRLFGNAILSAGRVPTYGFHRALLTMPSNGYDAVADACQWLTCGVEMIDEEVVAFTTKFKFGISAQAVSP